MVFQVWTVCQVSKVKRESEGLLESQVLLDVQEMMVSEVQSDSLDLMAIKEIGVLLDSTGSQDPPDHQGLQVLKASEGDRDILGLKEMMVRSERRERRELLVPRVTLASQERMDLMEKQELQERRETQVCPEPLVSEELWEFQVYQENRDSWGLQARRVTLVL